MVTVSKMIVMPTQKTIFSLYRRKLGGVKSLLPLIPPEIGTLIDNAMRAIEAENKSLTNVLPKNYASPDLDKRVLGDVVDLFTNMNMGDTGGSKDLLGRTYEYCIAQFAAYEGVKGGEFYTPSSIVKTIVAILKPFANCRVYDIKTPKLIQFNYFSADFAA